MENNTIKNKIEDILFSVWYIILFPLQMLPNIAMIWLETSNPLFWICCGIGVGALVAQSIQFPCHTQTMTRAATIGSWIGTWIWMM